MNRPYEENFMFGGNKKEVEALEVVIEKLQKKIETLEKNHEEEIKVLKNQLAMLVRGLPLNTNSIFSGLAYSEVPKEKVPSLIQETPHLLILDVRSDEGWLNGHIPQAKHIPAQQVFSRLVELSDKNRPILTICANGNTALTVAQMLAKEGYRYVFNALGGMAGYEGPIELPSLEKTDEAIIEGEDRILIQKVIEIMDRDVRPGLKRDGGDLKLLSVENGIVKVKMTGACLGCGSQKRTVEDGIKNHLMKLIPEIKGIEDHS